MKFLWSLPVLIVFALEDLLLCSNTGFCKFLFKNNVDRHFFICGLGPAQENNNRSIRQNLQNIQVKGAIFTGFPNCHLSNYTTKIH